MDNTRKVRFRGFCAGCIFVTLIGMLIFGGIRINQARASAYINVLNSSRYCISLVGEGPETGKSIWDAELKRRRQNAHLDEVLAAKVYTRRLREWEVRQAEIREEEARIAAEIAAEEAAREARINSGTYSPEYLMSAGVVYWGGYRFTWYSENVLPGYGLDIPGRWSDGDFVRDGDGYICVASSDLSKGTIVDTPWGISKVYDCGCASGTIDMYVSW